jgi:hypothetical protein
MMTIVRSVAVVCSFLLAVGLLVFEGACASADEPACVVDGTYTVTGVRESGNCAESSDPITDTFTTLSNGSVKLEIQSLPDLVPIGTMSGCKWTAAGSVTILDASGPEKKGTLQYSYTFNRTGFAGIVSVYVPPATSLPAGCTGTTKATGTRR